jgi:hypothetical protein
MMFSRQFVFPPIPTSGADLNMRLPDEEQRALLHKAAMKGEGCHETRS